MFSWTADYADYIDSQQTTDLTDYTELLMRKRMNFHWLAGTKKKFTHNLL